MHRPRAHLYHSDSPPGRDGDFLIQGVSNVPAAGAGVDFVVPAP